MTDLPALDLADYLCDTPLAGLDLVAELRAKFPRIKRDDVWLGIGIVLTYHRAAALEDAVELESLRLRARPNRI